MKDGFSIRLLGSVGLPAYPRETSNVRKEDNGNNTLTVNIHKTHRPTRVHSFEKTFKNTKQHR